MLICLFNRVWRRGCGLGPSSPEKQCRAFRASTSLQAVVPDDGWWQSPVSLPNARPELVLIAARASKKKDFAQSMVAYSVMHTHGEACLTIALLSSPISLSPPPSPENKSTHKQSSDAKFQKHRAQYNTEHLHNRLRPNVCCAEHGSMPTYPIVLRWPETC